MSLANAVPKGIREKECKRFALQESPLIHYVPEKDPVQETVSALKSDQSLKMRNYVSPSGTAERARLFSCM
jgi:hypothetical protein